MPVFGTGMINYVFNMQTILRTSCQSDNTNLIIQSEIVNELCSLSSDVQVKIAKQLEHFAKTCAESILLTENGSSVIVPDLSVLLNQTAAILLKLANGNVKIT